MINTKDVFLRIDDQRYIKFVITCPDQIFFHRFDPTIITFYNKEKEYLFSKNDYLGPEIETFQSFLQDALENKLNLPNFINKDLGYLYNQKLHSFQEKSSQKDDDLKRVNESLYNFLIFSEGDYSVWLYTKNNTVFLHITPMYKWHFSDPKENEAFVPYDEFIKNYASCLTVEIPKEVLSTWIGQCDEIMKLIIKNDGGIEPT